MTSQAKAVQNWAERQQGLARLTEAQFFFIGGAPRSGTTWLQSLLDSHPDISCRGEGLFWKTIAEPLERMMQERRKTLEAKNNSIFRHSGGYPLPESQDTEFLLRTAILLALHQQCAGNAYRAIGEKTPENVFFFPQLKRMFPAAKFIGIARDPRDVLTSAWHFFRPPRSQENEDANKVDFIRLALPSLQQGTRTMLALQEQHQSDCTIITYERMLEAPALIAEQLFRFLGVSYSADLVAACVAKTSFATLSGGRHAGVEQNGSFFRSGTAGDWRSTLTPTMNDMILSELGWMFPHFGWQP